MSLEQDKYRLQEAVAKYSRVTLYGLNYPTNLEELVNRNMIIKALDYDDERNNTLLTEQERLNLLSKLSTPIGSMSCSSC